MSKQLSLRGIITMDDNELSINNPIFTYEANDLTRGWVVEAAYMWPKTSRAGTGSDHGQYQLCASVATDIVPSALSFDEVCSAEDNRQIAWLEAGYQRRNSTVGDFLANSGNNPNPAAFTVDPQHVVAKGLWINCYTTSDSSTSPERDWNYMVILRPKKLDPKETILHLIKNVAQDVVN